MNCIQALLDVYTIQQEVGHLDKLRIGLVGDLANGRTVRSLAYLLSMYDDVKMYFVAPDVVRMKDDIKEFLSGRSALFLFSVTYWQEYGFGREVPLLVQMHRSCDQQHDNIVHSSPAVHMSFGSLSKLICVQRGRLARS